MRVGLAATGGAGNGLLRLGEILAFVDDLLTSVDVALGCTETER